MFKHTVRAALLRKPISPPPTHRSPHLTLALGSTCLLPFFCPSPLLCLLVARLPRVEPPRPSPPVRLTSLRSINRTETNQSIVLLLFLQIAHMLICERGPKLACPTPTAARMFWPQPELGLLSSPRQRLKSLLSLCWLVFLAQTAEEQEHKVRVVLCFVVFSGLHARHTCARSPPKWKQQRW